MDLMRGGFISPLYFKGGMNMLIKHICGKGEPNKKAQSKNGNICEFNKENNFTCDVQDVELAEHLLGWCDGRFEPMDAEAKKAKTSGEKKFNDFLKAREEAREKERIELEKKKKIKEELEKVLTEPEKK